MHIFRTNIEHCPWRLRWFRYFLDEESLDPPTSGIGQQSRFVKNCEDTKHKSSMAARSVKKLVWVSTHQANLWGWGILRSEARFCLVLVGAGHDGFETRGLERFKYECHVRPNKHCKITARQILPPRHGPVLAKEVLVCEGLGVVGWSLMTLVVYSVCSINFFRIVFRPTRMCVCTYIYMSVTVE